jgi:transposase
MDSKTLRRVASTEAGLAFQPVTLLALLTYCYAHEIYGSSQVEDLMCKDASFRQLCAQEFPGPRVIQRFRKENRDAIHGCLCAALSRQFSRNAMAGRLPALPEDQIPEEATRRILMAMFIDNVELNDG